MKKLTAFQLCFLLSLASTACDGALNDEGANESLDMSLLEQDADGEWYAPIATSTPDDVTVAPAEAVGVHNHLLGVNGTLSYWVVHGNGGHGSVCTGMPALVQQCANITAYVGGNGYYVTSHHTTYPCSAYGGALSLYCTVY